MKIPSSHPRAESLRIREILKKGFDEGIVIAHGLIAQGRGETFDYLIGEKTTPVAISSIRAAAAYLLIAERPVISVNGNIAVLSPKEIVELANSIGGKIEVNLFHRSAKRELLIKKRLLINGAKDVLGVGNSASANLSGFESHRRKVDPRGILVADTVLIPLEDGDRTLNLRKVGKIVIAIDLNPLSRTAQTATVTIVDNVVRAMPLLVKETNSLKKEPIDKLERIVKEFDNKSNLQKCISHISKRLIQISASNGVLK